MDSPPDLSPETAPFNVYQAALERGALAFQVCGDCAVSVFPARTLCPACGSIRLAWRDSAGAGEVYSATAVSSRGAEPHNVSLIQLDEGFRLMSSVTDIPADQVEIGARVRLSIRPGEDGPLPMFVLEPS